MLPMATIHKEMTDSKPKLRHVVITGASSGIGEALAEYYAGPGIHLSLTGRESQRLRQVAGRCRAKGAQVDEKIIDVTNREGMQGWLEKIDSKRPVDLVIANAGISAGMGEGKTETPQQVRRLFDTNLLGVLNTIDPLIPRMIKRGRGSIALMSSLAAFRGWPGAPAYCASKAAVKSYGEGLRGALSATGVNVHVICPGFVKSRMTDVNEFQMPFIMKADKAAQIIAQGIAKNRGRIAFPFPAHFFTWVCAALPDSLAQKILKRMPKKSSGKL
jgi:short-subunit dehydrogenase